MRCEFIEDSDEALASLFSQDSLLLDVRAEIEFQASSLPNSINIPILNTEERELVGTCYAERGADAAQALGMELVSGRTKEMRVDAWRDAVVERGARALFCWRGGLRSQIAQRWLDESGVCLPRVPGGYKRLRHFLMQQLERISSERRFIVVWGMTGCGKTTYLASQAQTLGFVDLEGLANHRGSAFGGVFEQQPPQATFENGLAVSMLRVPIARPIVLEGESKLIGRSALPHSLVNAMAAAESVVVEDTLANRVRRIVEEYVVFLLQRFAQQCSRKGCQEGCISGQEFDLLSTFLRNCLMRVRKKLGNERYQRLDALVVRAIAEHRDKGDPYIHEEWIKVLLSEYYDPQYTYQIGKNGQISKNGGGKHPLYCRPEELIQVVESLAVSLS